MTTSVHASNRHLRSRNASVSLAGATNANAGGGAGGGGDGGSSSNNKDTNVGLVELNPDDREALNARLSQRRQQRREARHRRAIHSTTSSESGGSASAAAGASLGGGGGGNNHGNKKPKTGSPYAFYSTRWNSKISIVWMMRILLFFFFLLIVLWIVGLTVLANSGIVQKRSQVAKLPAFLRNGISNTFQGHPTKQQLPPPPIKSTSNELIDMRLLNYELPFENPDGGVWKQGWDVEPVEIGKDVEPLKIFVLPHSHCDPGWIKTFDDYFQSQTKQILSTVITALSKDPRRKFIWAEISYFEWWWKEQDAKTHDLVRTLLRNGQFEFVTGGWVQPDEANTQLYAMEIQLQEGHDFIRETFGNEEYVPKFGWSIDPFGYSPTMAYLLKKYKFQGMLIQRVHYAVKKELAKHKQLEFLWRQTWDSPSTENGEYAHDIFTHLMPFYSYDVPHTCGPDPKICCQFDFARLLSQVGQRFQRCPWGENPQVITDQNVRERAMVLLDQYRKKAALYRSRVVLAPLGDDFRWETSGEAEAQYGNYQRIFDYINSNVPGVSIQFGTLKEYFTEVIGKFEPPILKGSFFTYSDRDQDYWSGYFTSRVFDKALDRKLERAIFAATSMGATKTDLQGPRRALSLFQHHDGVTGTAKKHVVEDYATRIHDAIHFTQDWMINHILSLENGSNMFGGRGRNMDLQACWQSDAPRSMSQNLCESSKEVVLYNPLQTEQSCGATVVAARSVTTATLPCEIPGALSESKAGIRFDQSTGLMTHPVKEEWMVWRVRSGGAYLFFPGNLQEYHEAPEIQEGGYVVNTMHWKRTVIEKQVPSESPGTTATVIDFVYETFLQNSNEEWFVRFTGDISNDGIFHTDLNGYNFDTHYFRKDMPIQSQVFPMPTLASIEDDKTRLTVLSEHAQGTASLKDGTIDVWLDRRLRQDDNRGLGEGVMDNVPTRTRLRVVLEAQDGNAKQASEFKLTPVSRRMWKELNHPLEMFGWPGSNQHSGTEAKVSISTGSKVSAISSSLKAFVPIVYMVYNRPDYLRRSIESLRYSDFPRDRVPIIVSYDGHVDAMTSYVNSIKSEFHVIEIFHPYSCSEHLDSFPGDDPKLNKGYEGDQYGNPREGHVTCCKHHFTWLMTKVFGMEEVKEANSFMFLEEDYVVAPTIYSTIDTGLRLLKKSKTKYFGLVFDPTDGFSRPYRPDGEFWEERLFISGPMLLEREVFDKIRDHAGEYCTFDDYNWDWSLVHLMSIGAIPGQVLLPSVLQVAHIGVHGGMHDHQDFGDATAIIENGDRLPQFHAKDPPRHRKQTHPSKRGFGGWGHPADHAHCKKLFSDAPASKNRNWRDFFGLG